MDANAELDLLIATTRRRLAKFTRPTFDRELVEDLLDRVESQRKSLRDWAASRDDIDWEADDDEDDDSPSEHEEYLEQVVKNQQASYQNLHNEFKELLAQHRALESQAHVLATQLQWMIDAEPEELAARLRYLRGMKARLGAGERD